MAVISLFLLASLPTPSVPADDAKRALPETTQKILSGATRVECFRIDPRTGEENTGKVSVIPMERHDGNSAKQS